MVCGGEGVGSRGRLRDGLSTRVMVCERGPSIRLMRCVSERQLGICVLWMDFFVWGIGVRFGLCDEHGLNSGAPPAASDVISAPGRVAAGTQAPRALLQIPLTVGHLAIVQPGRNVRLSLLDT